MLDTVSVPLPRRFRDLTIPERMHAVIRRHRAIGDGTTTRDDFRQAEETCDLSDADLDANIGAAKRLADPELEHHAPPAPVEPWDFDPEYRRERVERAAALVVGLAPDPGTINTVLRTAGFGTREVGALYPEIVDATARLFVETRRGH